MGSEQALISAASEWRAAGSPRLRVCEQNGRATSASRLQLAADLWKQQVLASHRSERPEWQRQLFD